MTHVLKKQELVTHFSKNHGNWSRGKISARVIINDDEHRDDDKMNNDNNDDHDDKC